MTPEQRKRIVARHSDSLLRHGHSPNALYWSTREIQELHFELLCDIGIQSGDSLLDVGCGFGDLKAYLARAGIEVDYQGVDLSPHLIEKGRTLYPAINLFEGDLFDFNPAPLSFDYVMLSGALNEPMKDGGAYARNVIRRMYESCRQGLAFNLLNAEHEWTANRFDLQSFLPQEMLAFCQGLGAQCRLHDDYLDNVFTLYLQR